MRQHIGTLNNGQGKDGDMTSTTTCQFSRLRRQGRRTKAYSANGYEDDGEGDKIRPSSACDTVDEALDGSEAAEDGPCADHGDRRVRDVRRFV